MKKSTASVLAFSALTAIAFTGCSHKKTMENDAQTNPPAVNDTAATSNAAPELVSGSATTEQTRLQQPAATTPDDQVTQVASLGASSSGRSR